MVLIFDPKLYPADERREAYEALLSSLSCPVSVTFDHAVTDDVIEGWQLGPSGQLLQGCYYSGQLARRTARHVRRGTQEKVSFSVNFRGDCATVRDRKSVV